MVGPGGRAQLVSERLCHMANHRMVGIGQWRRATHHIPLDIATGGDDREQLLIDARDSGLQVSLEHTMKLETLTSGDPQRAVGVAVGKAFEPEVLVSSDGS